MGTTDSVVVAWTNRPTPQPGFRYTDNIILWTPQEEGGAVDTSRDFDLHVGCGFVPTRTSYSARSISSDSMEFARVPETSCAPGQPMYVAISSYRGKGQFDFRISRSLSYAPFPPPDYLIDRPLNVRSTRTTLAGRQAQAAYLVAGAKHLFSITEGAHFPTSVCLCELGSNCPCSPAGAGPGSLVELWQDGSCPYYGYPRSHFNQYSVILCADAIPNNTEIMAHELGHSHLLLGDEYTEATQAARCGHSIMDDYFGRQAFQLCTNQGHGFDTQRQDYFTREFPLPSVWQGQQVGMIPHTQAGSPDPADLRFHDFNGQIPVTVY